MTALLAETIREDSLLLDLKIISRLKPGLTLCTPAMTIVNRGTWSVWLYRRMHRETKDSTIIFTEGILRKAVEFVEESKRYEHVSAVLEALKGFVSLSETYSGDLRLVEKISRICNELQIRCDNLCREALSSVTEDTSSTVAMESLEQADKDLLASSEFPKLNAVKRSKRPWARSRKETC